MGANTKIEWCDFTFNPFRGCTKVAEGCKFCYADVQAKRNPNVLGIWGPNGTRVVASDAKWREPVKWNRLGASEAEQPKTHVCRNCGTRYFCQSGASPKCNWKCEIVPYRPRVFCGSMCDVFEDWTGRMYYSEKDDAGNLSNTVAWWRNDIGICNAGQVTVGYHRNERLATMDDARKRLFRLIDATPNLDWLLLTKRPENIRRMWSYVPHTVLQEPQHQFSGHRYNVWLGCSVSTQKDADRDIPRLLECRDLSPVLFLSVEPLIEEVDLRKFINPDMDQHGNGRPDWVIIGGESGPNARPCSVDWIRSIVQQCSEADVACFVKQLGSEPRPSYRPSDVSVRLLKDKKGGDILEWPNDLRVREFP